MTDLIICKDVAFGYDGNIISQDINFTVHAGDYLCIVGENGSGKSTLMRGLLGLTAPAAGKISMAKNLPRCDIGYLPQQSPLQSDFPASVSEVVLSGRQNKHFWPFYNQADRATATTNMELLHIDNIRHQSYQQLSGGQKQRVLLARALCAAASMIMLDEPVTGFDPLIEHDFYTLLEHLNKKHHLTIVMVTHDIQTSLHYATHILHLSQRQLFYGTVDAYRQSEIGKLFLRRVDND